MTNKVCKIFSVILACVATMPGDAAVKTNNASRSYAGAYQQVNNVRAQQEYLNSVNGAAAQLPVTVDDENLARSIVNNESGAPGVSQLQACAMIYPNGNFKWGVPEYGINKDPQCLAVVELRDANSNTILAYTTVAAGQSIKCNIDNFPSGSYNMSALSKIELPADEAPTMEDVIAVMNEEQKQNAGLKIAAGAIIAGVAGNLLSQKDASNTNDKIPLGTGKSQLIGTAAGVAAGAGIMAASSYTGKVAGDTIKSTAVNAASGMLIGNMMAGANGSDSVIATVKCSMESGKSTQEYDCIVGNYQEYGDAIGDKEDGSFYIIKPDKSDLRLCSTNTDGAIECTQENKKVDNITLAAAPGSAEDSIPWDKRNDKQQGIYRYNKGDGDIFAVFNGKTDQDQKTYYRIKTASKIENTIRAYAVFKSGTLRKPLGYTEDDWTKDLISKTDGIFERYNGGAVGGKIEEADAKNFKPSSRDAEDGALIDLSNQARAKATIAGAAVGGAGGGLAGYTGAKNEVTERWLSAQREYEDSLTNVVCTTGARYLSQYNDYAEIPALKTE